MKEELIQKLRDEFSELPAEARINIGDGWYEVVRSMLRNLRKCNAVHTVNSIEAKMGRLRTDLSEISADADAAMFFAEQESKLVCDVCGGGAVPNPPYRATRCAEHAAGSEHKKSQL